jgi:protein-disulfide isomerase
MVSILVVIIGVLVSLWFGQRSNEEKTKIKTPNTLEESYKTISLMGQPTAPVHIVEFGDYKCPYCKKFHEEFVPFLVKEYVATGKVQFHFINFAFIGPDSTYMAEFAETVRQELGVEAYWRFHDLIYANQQNENVIWGTEKNMTTLLKSFASKEQVKQVLNAVKDGKYKQNIEMQKQLVNNVGVHGTPAIYINGKQAQFKSNDELKKLIEDAVNEKK